MQSIYCTILIAAIHPLKYYVSVFVTLRTAFIQSLKGTIFILTWELVVIFCLSNSFSSRFYSYFLEYSHDVKICSDPIWPMHFLSAYFRTPGTVKETYYRSIYMSRAVSIRMKWEKPLEAATFSPRDFFQNTWLSGTATSFL